MDFSIGLFLEIGVVGVGASVWFGFLVMTVAGYSWLDQQILDAPGGVIVALALVFVLGVIVDEIGDVAMGPFKKKLKKIYGFLDDEDVRNRKEEAFDSAFRRQALEYIRRRLRIARGWAVNSAALIVSYTLFVLLRLPDDVPRGRLLLWGLSGLSLLLVGTVFASARLYHSEYSILKGAKQSAI